MDYYNNDLGVAVIADLSAYSVHTPKLNWQVGYKGRPRVRYHNDWAHFQLPYQQRAVEEGVINRASEHLGRNGRRKGTYM